MNAVQKYETIKTQMHKTFQKRSNVMSYTKAVSRILSAVFSIFLIANLALGQNLKLGGSATTYGGTWKVKGNIDNTNKTVAVTFTDIVQLTGTAAQAVGVATKPDINFTTLTATGASGKTFAVNSSIATAIDMTTGTGTSFALAAGTKLTVVGAVNNTGTQGTYDFSTGEVNYAGATQTVYGTAYGKLTVSAAGTKSLGGAASVTTALGVSAGDLSIGANTLTIDGTYTVNTGSSVIGGTSSNMVLGGNGDLPQFAVTNGLNNFTLNRNTNTVTLSSPLSVAGALALNNGTLAVGTSTLTLKGAVSAAGSGALTSTPTGTVDYNAGTQTVLASNYGNLTFTAGNKTLPSTGTVGIAGAFSPGPGTPVVAGSTIDFNGTGTQTIPVFTYNNLVTEGAGSTKNAGGSLSIAGTLDNGGSLNQNVTLNMSTYTLGVTGDNTGATVQFGGPSNGVQFTTGTVEYNAISGDQIIAGNANYATNRYATLLLSGGGTKTVSSGNANVAVDGGLTVGSTVTLVVDLGRELLVGYTAGDLTIDGTVTNSGTITVGQ